MQTLSQDKTQSWFEALQKVMAEGVYVTNSEGVVMMANDAFTRVTGIAKKDILGVNIQDYLDTQYEAGAYIRLDIDLHQPSNKVTSKRIPTKQTSNKEATKDEVRTNSEFKYIGTRPDSLWKMVMEQKNDVSYASYVINDGRKISVRFLGHPLFDAAGKIEYVLVILQDISQYESLMGSLEKLEDKNLKYLSEIEYFRDNQRSNRNLIGEAKSIEALRKLIHRVGKTDVNVLIFGETGVGKEIVAQEIHEASTRGPKPYIKLNCSAIPENLLESELFGYEKGAFTGASNKAKIGYFEMANHGTLLLDEIGDMSYPLQAKLLRVLQDGEVIRVGGTHAIKLDVRVIASTNKNLMQMVQEGLFREDLYYRLNVMPINIPPLRERDSDIRILARHFLDQYNLKYQKNITLDDPAMAVLARYKWPGNVRELRSIIERLVIVNDASSIEPLQLATMLGSNEEAFAFSLDASANLKEMTNAFQKKIIESALKTHGSTYKAAKALGMNQSSISRKARELKIKTE